MSDQHEHVLAGAFLRHLAMNPHYRDRFLDPGSGLRQLTQAAADRFIVASTEDDLLPRLELLASRGYQIGVELVGEEARTPEEVDAVVAAYLSLLDTTKRRGQPAPDAPIRLGFDLSNIGLLDSEALARRNTATLLAASASIGSPIIISMERSSFVDSILRVHRDLAADHDNVGLTVQAHLHRTENDLTDVLETAHFIRLVKGVYHESADVALPRGDELDERYVRLAGAIAASGVPLSIATHDAALLAELSDVTSLPHVEVEMLHGVQPELLKTQRDSGRRCRIACVYGDNWWLHLLHRLAENPANVITALADLQVPERVVFGSRY